MLRRCERVEAGGDDFLVAQKKAGGNLTATPSSRRRTVSCGQSSGLGRAQRLALAEKVGAAHPVAGGFCHRRYVAFENPRGGGRHVERHGSCQAILRGLRDGQGLGRVPSLLHAKASFAAQAEPVAEVRTLQGYADWMKGLLTFMPDGRYVVKSLPPTMIETVCVPMASFRPPIPARAVPVRLPARARRRTTSM